jgi:MOSC domain-containing protein YiiM
VDAQEGIVAAGDEIELIGHSDGGVTISDITRLYVHDKHNVELLRRAISLEALSESWRGYFREQLEKTLRVAPRDGLSSA